MLDKIQALAEYRPKYTDVRRRGKWHMVTTTGPPRVTIKQMAQFINENMPSLKAEVSEGYHSGDSHISGTRLRNEGKDYYGNRLIVTDTTKKLGERGYELLDHNSVEPYRTNQEIAQFIMGRIKCL